MIPRPLSLLAALAAAAVLTPAQETPTAGKLTRAQQEQFLREGKVIEHHRLSEGVTRSIRATLEWNGFRHDVHIQAVDETSGSFRTSQGTQFDFKDSYKFNVAAYELAKLLGIEDLFPPSIQRNLIGLRAAVTWWVDDVIMDEGKRAREHVEPPDRERWLRQVAVIRTFDQLIYNTDRNKGNLLIDKRWDPWLIDHTRAFTRSTKIYSPAILTRCDRAFLARLRELKQETLEKQTGVLLTKPEVAGVMARRDQIVKVFDGLIQEKGETVVLFDRPQRETAGAPAGAAPGAAPAPAASEPAPKP